MTATTNKLPAAPEVSLRKLPLTKDQRYLLANARIQKGWSQKELARLAGCSMRAVQRIENDEMSPMPALMTRLCHLLGIAWMVEVRTIMAPVGQPADQLVGDWMIGGGKSHDHHVTDS
jgi:ribosome-binding protein aMBF1 (putative translation factor)